MKNHRRDYSTLLIWAAALVTVVRYSAAFMASDMGAITGLTSEIVTFFMGLTGIGMGILDVVGGTYLFQSWRRVMPKTGKKWSFRFIILTFFVFGLFASGIFILTPFTVSRVLHTTMESVLGTGAFLFVWSGLVNVIVYFLIGGVAVGNIILTSETGSTGSESFRQVSEVSAPTKGNFPVSWRTFRLSLSRDDVRAIAKMTTTEICRKYNLQERTARNWRANAQKEIQDYTV